MIIVSDDRASFRPFIVQDDHDRLPLKRDRSGGRLTFCRHQSHSRANPSDPGRILIIPRHYPLFHGVILIIPG
jgi:hypothetical protein